MDPGDRPAAVAETHSAVVFFAGDRAYKAKKAVDLGFLDFTTLASRKAACEREVELNRRLAPDVYLGVADVHGPDGEVCDHLVVMRRMPDERRLSTLVTSGVSVSRELWQLAHLLAAFHARCPRSPEADRAAGTEATRDRWRNNTNEMLQLPTLAPHEGSLRALQARAERYLEGREPLFAARVRAGRAVDGHGDLLADDIFCLDDGPRVLDCIEFDDRLRRGDALADVAFLVMDLERLGRSDLGGELIEAYREHSGDVWPTSLVHHQVAYRAQVRAKVRAIRGGQGDEQAILESEALVRLAEAHLDAGQVRLIIVGGLPGTGKSTLAAGLGTALSATVLRSDEVRKDLHGLPTDQPRPAGYGQGLYSPSATVATYEALLSRAEIALGLGETVILDASWSDAAWRARARSVGHRAAAELAELRCEAPAALADARIEQRGQTGHDPSDATPHIAHRMAEEAEPWPESTPITTADDEPTALRAALEAIGADPGGTFAP